MRMLLPGAGSAALEALERGGAGEGKRGRLLEGRPRQGCAASWSAGASACSANVPVPSPKTGSPGRHRGDVRADGLDDAGEVGAADGLPRPAQPEDAAAP